MINELFLGKTMLVSGPLDDISGGIVSRFLREGANVVTTDSEERAAKYLPDYELYKKSLLCLPIEIRNESEIEDFVNKAAAMYGTVDCLVNDQVEIIPGTCEKMTRDGYVDTFVVNQLSAFLMAKYALPYLKKTHGSIVNITTMAAVRGLPESAAYIPSRAGLIGLTRSLARDYAADGVRVNAVAEGFIETPLLRASPIYDSILARCPLGRLGRIEDIAAAVAFLASSEASYISGIIMDVEGGVGLDY